jgi:N-acetyl-anhydromuramyl-L-alanine amidase AmpD
VTWWPCRVFDRWIEVSGPREVDGVVTAGSARQQEAWARSLGGRLPTAEEFDHVWLGADVKVEPIPRDVTKAPLTALNEEIVLARRFPEQTVCAGKTWIQHPRQAEKGAVNYGWFVPLGEVRIVGSVPKWRGMNVLKSVTGQLYVIQSPGATHGPDHADYSQLLYAVRELDKTPVTRPDVETPPTMTEPGDRGDAVRAWQRYLLSLQYAPGPVDGMHDPMTERATEAWLRDRGLERERRATITIVPPPRLPHEVSTDRMPVLTTELPHIKFKQDPNYKPGRPSGTPLWVVVHTAECRESPTAAEALQGWDSVNVSWHYAVDSDSITQSVREADRSQSVGHNPAQERGVHLELAGYARQTEEEWADDYSQAMLNLGALLVAHICKRWNIPAEHVGSTEMRANVAGICGHADVTRAWPGTTTHVDPGVHFPWERFVDLVSMNLSLLT